MMQADLHVHSLFSDRPSEWFLKRIGTRESYTPVETVYRTAKKRGMDLVTLTDHNTIDGALQLREHHPDDTFISVEATTYFPEDGCKIHVLAYDITERQFAEIDRVRDNIYDLRDYLRQERLACSVAHPAYSINGKLNVTHLEKLLLLFNVFEGLNGSRPALANNTWMDNLEVLTPAHIERLTERYRIQPWGETPWVKGFTAGSDDHAGIFVATTCTRAPASGRSGFLEAIARGETMVAGRHNDFKGLAFSLYKIAWDFYKHRSTDETATPDMLGDIFGLVFDNKRIGAKNWLTLQQVRMRRNEKNRAMSRFFDELAACMEAREDMTMDERHDRIYESIATLADDYFAMIMRSAEKDIRKGNAFKLLKNVSAALPGVFLSTPFLSTLRHMHLNRSMLRDFSIRCRGEMSVSGMEKKVLWFSDTLHELNGVSETLKTMTWKAHEAGRALNLVVSVPPEQITSDIPPNTINLPFVWEWCPDFYNSATIRIPSLLKSIEIINAFCPDEIIISTPGPVGLMGLLAAKLLSVHSVAIYHTDFTRQANLFIADDFMTGVTENYMRWFHSLTDEIRVPTRRYIPMLGERGYDVSKMRVFKRGMDLSRFQYTEQGRARIRTELGLNGAPVLLWAGRLGKEKSLDFLADVYEQALRQCPDLRLIIAGEGPLEKELRDRFVGCRGVVMPGRIAHEELPDWYSAADLFVFPSVTDTFGMVILEAQACGLPALVTDIGGPQELIQDEETGKVIAAGDRKAWTTTILDFVGIMEKEPHRHIEMRLRTRARMEQQASWQDAVNDLIDPSPVRSSLDSPIPDLVA